MIFKLEYTTSFWFFPAFVRAELVFFANWSKEMITFNVFH